MGLFGSLIGGAVSGAIKRAIDKSKSNSGSSSSGVSSGRLSGLGGVASSTTNSLRDYMGQRGQTVDYDASTGMTTIGGKQYASGSIPGTSYNQTTGQHYVTDPSALNSALDITTSQQPQQYIVDSSQQQNQYDPTEHINRLKAAKKTEGPFENPDMEDDSENDNEVIE